MPQTCKGAVYAQVAMGRFVTDAVADPRSTFYHCLIAAEPRIAATVGGSPDMPENGSTDFEYSRCLA